jgi:predicted nucleic acid-binding protein
MPAGDCLLTSPTEDELGNAQGVDARTMMLLDTNVLIYASDEHSKLCRWARRMIADGVSGEGAAVNAVSIAEVCVGDAEPQTVSDRIRAWGVIVLDVPAAASEVCARAYLAYRTRRKADSGKDAPAVPLPDFFIGAHAQVMGWTLVTADDGRFKTYFPAVVLRSP